MTDNQPSDQPGGGSKPGRSILFHSLKHTLVCLFELEPAQGFAFPRHSPTARMQGSIPQPLNSIPMGARPLTVPLERGGQHPARLPRSKMGSLGFVSLRLIFFSFLFRLKRMQKFPDVEKEKTKMKQKQNKKKPK